MRSLTRWYDSVTPAPDGEHIRWRDVVPALWHRSRRDHARTLQTWTRHHAHLRRIGVLNGAHGWVAQLDEYDRACEALSVERDRGEAS